MNSSKHKLSTTSRFAQDVHQGRRPMLLASSEVVDGYAQLEYAERNYTQDAIKKHREEVSVWYQALGLFLDGIRGEWQEPEEPNQQDAYRICHEMIALEVGNAKVALDNILAGYYSMGFAAIRHILECVAQCLYLIQFPEKTGHWEVGSKVPPMREIRRFYKNEHTDAAELFKAVDDGWQFMSSGSHPSGNGLLQVRRELNDPGNIVGAYCRENLAYIGLAGGLLSMSYLLFPMETIRPGNSEWNARRDSWQKRLDEVLESMHKRPRLAEIWEEEASEKERVAQEDLTEE